jgi:hypothetical protein
MLLDRQTQVHHKHWLFSEDPKIPLEATDPTKIPRGLKKKPRTGAAGNGVVTAGNSSTPHLGHVSLLLSLSFASFLFKMYHLLILLPSYAFRLFCSL